MSKRRYDLTDRDIFFLAIGSLLGGGVGRFVYDWIVAVLP